MYSDYAATYTGFIAFTFITNLPFGYLREKFPKFSLSWFACIHATVPFIILLRRHHELGWQAIPLSFIFAVAGQLIGGQIKKKRTP